MQLLADFESKESFDSDIIALETNNKAYKEKCGESCIILVTVDGNSSATTAHYNLQVTRDMIEVTEGLRLTGHLTEFTNYRFYKFYKSCKDTCDLDIVLSP
jgi:hypothetical protein